MLHIPVATCSGRLNINQRQLCRRDPELDIAQHGSGDAEPPTNPSTNSSQISGCTTHALATAGVAGSP